MIREFSHTFDPAKDSPIRSGMPASLTVREIEDAALLEVLQTSGARIGAWGILEALLEPGEKKFRFREPLGAAREVKVAVSGLFGRFVARAYLQKYFKCSFFAHLGTRAIKLSGRSFEIRRMRNVRGDLPDWVAATKGVQRVIVAEAKGCHDRPGPERTLKRAWSQANRVDVFGDGKRLPLKRIAIATRWASVVDGAAEPIIAVRDPEEPGDQGAAAHVAEAGIGLARLHMADLLQPLGYGALAEQLRATLELGRGQRARRGAEFAAMTEVQQARAFSIDKKGIAPVDQPVELIGAYVTQAGPIATRDLSQDLLMRLEALGLRPRFIGVDKALLRAVAEGDIERVRFLQGERQEYSSNVSRDSGGTWIAELRGGTTIR